MDWEKEALVELEKVPFFVRKIAKDEVEKLVRAKGEEMITRDDVAEAQRKRFEKEEGVTNIAVVRCEIISEVCPGVGCFTAFSKRTEKYKDEKYKEYGPKTKMIGFFTCGGCPGRRVFRLANTLKRYSVDAVHLSSCMLMDEPFPKCPHKEEIKKTIEKLEIKVVEGTHHEVGQYAGGTPFHRE